MNTNPSLENRSATAAKLRELTKGIRSAMITTTAPDGDLHSRPMAVQDIEDDGILWFFTAIDSGKAHELEGNHHVNVAYVNESKDRFVSVAGAASVVRDAAKAKALWSPFVKAYFPAGLDDPRLALLRIEITSVAYWDVKESKMVQLFEMARAAVGHHPPKIGEHGKIDLPLRR